MKTEGSYESYTFCSFQQRDLAYERIFAIWRASSPYAAKFSNSSAGNKKVRSNTLSSDYTSDSDDVFSPNSKVMRTRAQ